MSKVAAGDASTRLVATAIGSIGVVFGDIGTSPLYTLQVAADGQGGGGLTRDDVFGVVSLILWALILAVSVKYVTFVMRADNRGEGGILALLALLRPTETAGTSVIALLVIVGAALLFGDGLITPAISVLSALEGLQMAAPGFEPYIVPLTCAVLLVLFAVQRRGTGGLGALFGPVMVVWFATIGALGLHEILKNGEILGAVSPIWGARYFARHGLHGLGILGVVVLAITGGEALYADMGHFGPRPIRLSWFSLVLPALALSYLGQGALILRDPRALANPFFAMVPPGPATYALVALAAMATTIASQALISGVFSLTHQAVQLGYFPRVTIRHTSREAEGQIYVPLMNWGLMAGSIALVLAFRHSARLGAAYGIAVSGTMAITSVAFFEVTRKAWRWPAARSVPLLLLFLSFDLPFFGANLLKFVDGGYIPILVGALFFVMMLDWHVGRQVLREILEGRSVPFDEFANSLASRSVARAPGTGIYLSTTRGVPHTLAMQADRLRSIMERIVLLTVVVEHEPQVDDASRYEVESLTLGFVRVLVHFGYMENPLVPPVLERALQASGVGVSLDDATYYVGRETVVAGKGGRMGRVSEGLFAFLARNATSAIAQFGLPLDQVVELGTWLDL
jgi:KUP system potassium uptake protein